MNHAFMPLCLVLATAVWAGSATAKDIVHDAEYYVLEAQHGEDWATQDAEIQARLAALKEKHDTPPNIIHIMWDDTALGLISERRPPFGPTD